MFVMALDAPRRSKLILRTSRIVSDVSFSASPEQEAAIFLELQNNTSGVNTHYLEVPQSSHQRDGHCRGKDFLTVGKDQADQANVFPDRLDDSLVQAASKTQTSITCAALATPINVSDKIPIFGFLEFFACFRGLHSPAP